MSDSIIVDKRILSPTVCRIDVTCPWDLDYIHPGHAVVIETEKGSGWRVHPIMAVDERRRRLALVAGRTEGKNDLAECRVGHHLTMLGGPIGSPIEQDAAVIRLLADAWGCAALFWWLKQQREKGKTIAIHHRDVPAHSALGGMLTGLTRDLTSWDGRTMHSLSDTEPNTIAILAVHPDTWAAQEQEHLFSMARERVWFWIMPPCFCLEGKCLGCRVKTSCDWWIPCVQGFMIPSTLMDWAWWSRRWGLSCATEPISSDKKTMRQSLRLFQRWFSDEGPSKAPHKNPLPGQAFYKVRTLKQRLSGDKDALTAPHKKDIFAALDELRPELAQQAREQCPLHIDWPHIREALLQRDCDKAAVVLSETQPWPGLCGRLCEAMCETELHQDRVHMIRWLEAALAAWVKSHRKAARKTEQAALKKRCVAVIGAGSAGYAAAWRLNRSGIGVDVFEAYPTCGGEIRLAPEFQCPSKIKKRIPEVWSAFKQMRLVGQGVLDRLLRQGYDAVLIATGKIAWPTHLGKPPEVLYLDEFWHKWWFSPGWVKLWPTVVKRVVLTGQSLWTFAAGRLLCRRGIEATVLVEGLVDTLPLHPFDVWLAQEEGVALASLRRAVAFHCDDNGRLNGVEAAVQDFVMDEGGRRLVDVPSETETFPADAVIIEGGRWRSWASLFFPELAADESGRLFVDSATGMTSRAGVFAAGPVVSGGPTSLPESLAQGIQVAASIEDWIQRNKKI